jgi:ABC-2 type transport system permease protein
LTDKRWGRALATVYGIYALFMGCFMAFEAKGPTLATALIVGPGYGLLILWVVGRKLKIIAQRELRSVFTSPLAYVAATAFLLLVGTLYAWHFDPGQEASLRQLFNDIVVVLVLAVPLLTMSLLSEEYSRGTIETMMTAPVSEVEVTLGKFLGVLGFYIALLATTLPHYILLRVYGEPEVGQAVVGYFGMLLVGTAFISIGLFFSSLTRHQLLSALLTALSLAVVTLLPWLVRRLSGTWADIIKYVSVTDHFDNFSKGIVDSSSLVFLLSVTVFFLFVTVKVLESRRWR